MNERTTITPRDLAKSLGVSVKTIDRFSKRTNTAWRYLTRQQRYLNQKEASLFIKHYRTFRSRTNE